MVAYNEFIAKVKDIVTYFKQNVTAADELRRIQKQQGKSEGSYLKLKQDIVTRWNSCYYILEKFVQLSAEVSTVLLKYPKAPIMITVIEMETLKDVINILRPIEANMRELSSEKLVTSSKVIPMVNLS